MSGTVVSLAAAADAPVDRSSPVPLFLQIRQALLADIRNWSDATLQFPTDAALAARFGVSKMTVRQALDDLVASGLLERHRGRGTFVTDRAFIEQLDPALDIDQQYASAGHPQTTRILGFERRGMTSLEQKLFGAGGEGSQEMVSIRRLRSANGMPLALDERVMRADIADRAGFDPATATGSIVGRLRDALDLSLAKWRMSALLADADLSLTLCIPLGAPVLERAMTYFDAAGAVVLTGRSLHRGDLVSCAFELPLGSGTTGAPNELTRRR